MVFLTLPVGYDWSKLLAKSLFQQGGCSIADQSWHNTALCVESWKLGFEAISLIAIIKASPQWGPQRFWQKVPYCVYIDLGFRVTPTPGKSRRKTQTNRVWGKSPHRELFRLPQMQPHNEDDRISGKLHIRFACTLARQSSSTSDRSHVLRDRSDVELDCRQANGSIAHGRLLAGIS